MSRRRRWRVRRCSVARTRWRGAQNGAVTERTRSIRTALRAASQYHYPSVIQARDGAIHVTYSYFTAQGKAIKHVRFEEAWVKAGD